jgi:hypothetical protein
MKSLNDKQLNNIRSEFINYLNNNVWDNIIDEFVKIEQNEYYKETSLMNIRLSFVEILSKYIQKNKVLENIIINELVFEGVKRAGDTIKINNK